eukprot:730521-Pyramimonas_sp.AAC.1
MVRTTNADDQFGKRFSYVDLQLDHYAKHGDMQPRSHTTRTAGHHSQTLEQPHKPPSFNHYLKIALFGMRWVVSGLC